MLQKIFILSSFFMAFIKRNDIEISQNMIHFQIYCFLESSKIIIYYFMAKIL